MAVKTMHLAIEYQPMRIERPTSIAILDDGKVIGLIELEEFDHIAGKLKEMRDAHTAHMRRFNKDPHT